MKNIEIKNNMLKVEIHVPLDGRNVIKMLDRIGNEIVEKAYYVCDSNKAKAADLLGMNRTTVVERIRNINIKLIHKPHCGHR